MLVSAMKKDDKERKNGHFPVDGKPKDLADMDEYQLEKEGLSLQEIKKAVQEGSYRPSLERLCDHILANEELRTEVLGE